MLVNSIKELVSTRYANLQNPNAGQFAPRTGYYWIVEVVYKRFGTISEFPYAKVKWAKKPDGFLEDLDFEIELFTLYNHFSEGPKHILYEDLAGKVIHVSSMEKQCPQSGKCRYSVTWNVVDVVPIILTAQDVFFMCFFHPKKSFHENYQSNFVDTLEPQVVETLLWQENQLLHSAFDAYDADTDDPSDALDAPGPDTDDPTDPLYPHDAGTDDPNDAPDAPDDSNVALDTPKEK